MSRIQRELPQIYNKFKNKRPMGHIAHLRKQTHFIIVMLIKRRKKNQLWKLNCSSFKQTWIPFTKGCFLPNLVEIGPAVLEKKIFKFRQCILTISWSSPLGKGLGLSFEQTWFLITQWGIVPSLKLAEGFWRRGFLNFAIISPWKRVGPFTWTNLNPHHPRRHCAKFGWNWHSDSGEDF